MPDAKEAEINEFYEDLQHLLELTLKKKKGLFITEDYNAKVESQEISKIDFKYGLGVQNEVG